MRSIFVAARATMSLLLGVVAASAAAEWRVSTSTDEMTGESSWYTNSSCIGPRKPMAFPYSGVKSSIGYGCKDKGGRISEWVYLSFSDAPNRNRRLISSSL